MRVTRSSLSGGVVTNSKSRGAKVHGGSSKGTSSKRLSKSEKESDHSVEEESEDDDGDNQSSSNQSGQTEDRESNQEDESEAADEGDFDSEVEEDEEEENGKEVQSKGVAKKNQSGSKVANRPAYMKKIGLSADILTNADQTRLVSLARHRNILKPFVTEKVYNMLSTTLQKRGQDSAAAELKNNETIRQPKSLVKCTMRSYQLEGLSWFVNNYNQKINCMLGDEMGLGSKS
jgi:cobalamin biosynthesis protein CobT